VPSGSSTLAHLFSRFAKKREQQRERERESNREREREREGGKAGFGKTVRGNQFKSNVYDVS